MTGLPEDFKSWPKDPFELLGVERSDDARAAKRKYFKLIRTYKPDRCPVEFQKIREAYESVLDWLSWQQDNDDHDEDVEASSETSDWVGPSSFAENQSAEVNQKSVVGEEVEGCSVWEGGRTSRSSKLIKTDPVEMFFEVLRADGLRPAIPELQNVDPSQGSEQIAKARLLEYFAGRFYPEAEAGLSVDSSSDETELGYSEGDLKRIAWLLQALSSAATFRSAMIQLRYEFDHNYRLADCKIVRDYLANVQGYQSLACFFKLRWEAIGHHRPWVVVNDMNRLQPHSLEFSGYQGDWLSLLAESMNYTVWQQGSQYIAHTEICWQEISENDQSWTADSVEILMFASEQWEQMRVSASGWMAAIPWARNTLPETSRAIWMPVAKEISEDPIGTLEGLDYCFSAYSMAMTVFEEGLQNLAQREVGVEGVDELLWDETRELVSCFFMELGTNDYAESRMPILEFCIQNQMTLMTFASALNTFSQDEESETWFDIIQRDAALRCVVNACHTVNV